MEERGNREEIAVINREHPETYLASGLQNGIRQAFGKGAKRLKWDVAKIQAKGAGSLRRFKKIGRVEVRVAGSQRRIPYKIMPDPDEGDLYVIAQRDPDTGELIPQKRRGGNRRVERGKDGIWRLVHS